MEIGGFDMEKISKEITLYVPGDYCNMRCSYCYLTENFHRNRNCEMPDFKYPVDHMIKAFDPVRIGGLAHIIVIGSGETLIDERVVELSRGLVEYGHIVEVVTNGTLTKRIEELIKLPLKNIDRLVVKCSLHWNELKRLNLVEEYFDNIKKCISAGASSYPFLVIGDEYMNELEEINAKCQEELNVSPVCSPCVVETDPEQIVKKRMKSTSPASDKNIVDKVNQIFDSEVYRQCLKVLEVDVRNIFCYAGKYSFGVLLQDGGLIRCHQTPQEGGCFFENIDNPFCGLDYVGNECAIGTCCLQYDMFAFGLIPEIENIPTYAEYFIDNPLFTETFKKMTNCKFEIKSLSDDEKCRWFMKRNLYHIEKFKEYRMAARRLKAQLERGV